MHEYWRSSNSSRLLLRRQSSSTRQHASIRAQLAKAERKIASTARCLVQVLSLQKFATFQRSIEMRRVVLNYRAARAGRRPSTAPLRPLRSQLETTFICGFLFFVDQIASSDKKYLFRVDLSLPLCSRRSHSFPPQEPVESEGER